MANKFNDELNTDIRRTLRNALQKVRRAEKRGQRGLPTIPMVSEFKAMYTTEKDAKKELAQYKTLLNNKEALKRHRTKDGTISNWEFDYIINNLQTTEAWIDREIKRAMKRYADYPSHLYAIRGDLNTLIHQKEVIQRDLDQLTAKELKTVSATIDTYKRRNIKTSSGRKYFMKNLDSLLQAKGLSKNERQQLYDKLNSLSNDQFLELYKRHDVVSDIMLTIDSDPKNPLTSEERKKRAEDALKSKKKNEYNLTSAKLDEFAESLDDYITEAKATVDHKGESIITKSGKKLTYEDFMKLMGD